MILNKSLFFGELPDTIFHGVSLSNYRMLRVLNDLSDVVIISDESSFNSKSSFHNLKRFINPYFKLLRLINVKFGLLYVTCPLSFFAQLRYVFFILLFKLINNSSKVVAHLHRADLDIYCASSSNKFILKTFVCLVDEFIVLSQKNVDDFDKFGFDVNSKILPNTVSDEVKVNVNPLNKLGVICLNNYIETKGYREFFDALSENNLLRDVSFNTFGSIADKVLFDQLSDYNFDNISLNSTITGVDKFNELANAKFLIMPSLNEGMPLVILEALSVSTPVICFDIGCISDYLGKDYPGLVKTKSYSDFITKLNELMWLSDDQYKCLCDDSYKLYWSSFSNDIVNKLAINYFQGIFNE